MKLARWLRKFATVARSDIFAGAAFPAGVKFVCLFPAAVQIDSYPINICTGVLFSTVLTRRVFCVVWSTSSAAPADLILIVVHFGGRVAGSTYRFRDRNLAGRCDVIQMREAFLRFYLEPKVLNECDLCGAIWS